MSGTDEENIRSRTLALIKRRRESGASVGLISLLQDIQDEFGYLPTVSMLEAAAAMDVSPADVYGVASFYNQFRFVPPGKHHVKVCMGTACAIKMGGIVMESWERRLAIKEGEVTADREYSLERVACVGCCSMAPVTVIRDEVFGDMAPTKVDGILLGHKLEKEAKDRGDKGGKE